MKRILITGGTGFLGKNLAYFLKLKKKIKFSLPAEVLKDVEMLI